MRLDRQTRLVQKLCGARTSEATQTRLRDFDTLTRDAGDQLSYFIRAYGLRRATERTG